MKALVLQQPVFDKEKTPGARYIQILVNGYNERVTLEWELKNIYYKTNEEDVVVCHYWTNPQVVVTKL